jgi:GNAT superfamily N-acetyltransferase
MIIREARPADLPELLTLVKQYHQFEEIELDESLRQKALTSLIQSEFGKLYIAESNAQLIAYLALCKGFSIESGGEDGFIDELFVLKNQRGQGAGQALLSAALEAAQSMGLNAVYLLARVSNVPAHKLYNRFGFKPRHGYSLLDLKLNS